MVRDSVFANSTTIPKLTNKPGKLTVGTALVMASGFSFTSSCAGWFEQASGATCNQIREIKSFSCFQNKGLCLKKKAPNKNGSFYIVQTF